MAHKHSIYDTNLHFTIDPVTRVISNQVASKSVLIQGDHNSERFTFELPRLVDGHDMTLCDKIEVHYTNIAADKSGQSKGVYPVDDVQASPDSEDVAIFSWLISGNATKYEGILAFLIRFVCATGETLDYAWHTSIYNNVNVGEGMNNGEEVIAQYSDLLASWESRLFGVSDVEEQNLLRVSAEQQTAIEEKGRSVLESLPEDYANLITQTEKLGIEVKTGKNLYDPSKRSPQGQWYNYQTGEQQFYPDNQYIANFSHSDFIPVTAGKTYTWSGGSPYGTHYCYSYVIFDADKNFITGELKVVKEPVTVTIPDNGAYVVLVFPNLETTELVQFEEGAEYTVYEAYYEETLLNGVKIHQSQVISSDEDRKNRLLHLPEKYDLVVGDTFELFYKGVMLCKDPYRYNIEVNCSIGKAWGKKFEVTPTTIGSYALSITVTDDDDNVLDSDIVTLEVHAKATSPAEQVNVLCVGDSLTQGGAWVEELRRRLLDTDNKTIYAETAPTGDGLTNIRFIGKKQTAKGAGYEGFGGWRWERYLSTATSTSDYWVTCTHNKTDNDQESIYKDVNGVQWQLETIESSRLKFKKYSGAGSLPSSGTLTWVSGGVDTSAVTYSKATLEDGNPFVYNGAVDFSAYCADLGVDHIDQCYILLGWNSVEKDELQEKADAKTFIDLLIQHNANIKITLIGLQIPSLDGCANNYGATGAYTKYRSLQKFVFNLDRRYREIADEYVNNVDCFNLSGQFDTENNMITTELPLNARNPKTVTVQSNGVHPANIGYYQIADAVYRHFIANL